MVNLLHLLTPHVVTLVITCVCATNAQRLRNARLCIRSPVTREVEKSRLHLRLHRGGVAMTCMSGARPCSTACSVLARCDPAHKHAAVLAHRVVSVRAQWRKRSALRDAARDVLQRACQHALGREQRQVLLAVLVAQRVQAVLELADAVCEGRARVGVAREAPQQEVARSDRRGWLQLERVWVAPAISLLSTWVAWWPRLA